VNEKGKGWMAEGLWFFSRHGREISCFSKASMPSLGPTDSPNQGVPEAPSSGIKRQGHVLEHSSPSSAEVKNKWIYTSSLSYVFVACTRKVLPYGISLEYDYNLVYRNLINLLIKCVTFFAFQHTCNICLIGVTTFGHLSVSLVL